MVCLLHTRCAPWWTVVREHPPTMNSLQKSLPAAPCAAIGISIGIALCLCSLLTGCASSNKPPTDEGSYLLGEKKEGEDPLSLHGTMEVSVGYSTGDFRDARRAAGR